MLSPSALALAAALVAAPAAPAADTQAPPKAEAAQATPEAAVSEFYAYHLKHNKGLTLASVAERRRWLDDRLSKALTHYLKLPQKKDEVPLIDGDPFTDSQEYPDAYKVGAPQVQGELASVPVTFSYSGDGSPYQLKVELRRSKGAWRISDVFSADGKSLLKLLPK